MSAQTLKEHSALGGVGVWRGGGSWRKCREDKVRVMGEGDDSRGGVTGVGAVAAECWRVSSGAWMSIYYMLLVVAIMYLSVVWTFGALAVACSVLRVTGQQERMAVVVDVVVAGSVGHVVQAVVKVFDGGLELLREWLGMHAILVSMPFAFTRLLLGEVSRGVVGGRVVARAVVVVVWMVVVYLTFVASAAVGLGTLSWYTFALVAAVAAAVVSMPVVSVSLDSGQRRLSEVVRAVVMVAVCPVGIWGVWVVMALPVKVFQGRLSSVKVVAEGPGVARVSAAMGIDLVRAVSKLPPQLVSGLNGAVLSGESTALLGSFALVGDRVLSLALAERAHREGWSVGHTSSVSQRVLTNAALARYFDIHLRGSFRYVGDGERRRGTFVEALVGAYYLSDGSMREVEDFVMGQLMPVTVGK